VHLTELQLTDFRNYPEAHLSLAPGVSTLLGANGQGKTNLIEAAGYLATLGSHRVSQDAPLVRHGAASALVRAQVVRRERPARVELEIVPGRANRARLNGSPVSRPREILGTVRTVLFAPEDLAMVKGDPGERRSFLDSLLVLRQPRWAGVIADYGKIVRQRTAALKAGGGRSGRPRWDPAAVEVWDEHLAMMGGQLMYARLRLTRDLTPLLAHAYDEVSACDAGVHARYRASVDDPVAAAVASGEVPEAEELQRAILATIDTRREEELARGVCLVGPHRDELVLQLGELPARGYASHGESWSFALGLRLAAYQLLRNDLGDDPVLILDDVFAELDTGRRERLATLIADCEQVIITAAVAQDVPAALAGDRFVIAGGAVHHGDHEP
jgi:DNA replication and repair protein RecF